MLRLILWCDTIMKDVGIFRKYKLRKGTEYGKRKIREYY